MKPNTVILGWPNSWRKREDDSTKVFVDTIRNAGAGKMALLVPKGIQRFPDTGDTVKVGNHSSVLEYYTLTLQSYMDEFGGLDYKSLWFMLF